MKATAFLIVFALSVQLASAAHSNDCHSFDDLIDNINSTILGTCSVDSNCMQVNCVNSPLPGLGDSSITVLPCAFPRPSLNLLVLNENGDVLGNFTSYKDETNQNLTEGGVNVYSLDWIVRYNKADSSLTFQLNGTDLNSGGPPGSVIDTATIPMNRSMCAECSELQQLADNIDPNILGVCGVKTPCLEVGCVDSPLPGLGDSSITVLPCAFPRPSLNLLVLKENGDVLKNFTSYRNEANRILITFTSNLFISLLDWTIQYNKADSSLTFQLNGTNLNGTSVPVISTTTIPLDMSECAGAPGMKFMLSAILLSLLIALLA